eukprot:527181-Rhodomonas_salina.4
MYRALRVCHAMSGAEIDCGPRPGGVVRRRMARAPLQPRGQLLCLPPRLNCKAISSADNASAASR